MSSEAGRTPVGLRNFRELGGTPLGEGARIRTGVLYRSGALAWLTDEGLGALEQLGLATVYDLRTEQEQEEAPSRLPEQLRLEQLPIGGTAARTKELWESVMRGEGAELPPDFLSLVYASLAEDASTSFGRLMTLLAGPGAPPALIHCTAGKDRTGIAVALLLSSLGAHDEVVLDDYVRSAVVYSPQQLAKLQRRLEGTGIDVARYQAIFGAPREAMGGLLATLRQRHGSVRAYLVDEGGVSDAIFPELQDRLVEVPHGS